MRQEKSRNGRETMNPLVRPGTVKQANIYTTVGLRLGRRFEIVSAGKGGGLMPHGPALTTHGV